MSTAWTPGPWAAYYRSIFTGANPEIEGVELIGHRRARAGAAANRDWTGFHREEDARLAALAPEMAESILAAHDAAPGWGDLMRSVYEKLRAIGGNT